MIGWYPFIIHGMLEFQSGSVRRPITTFWRVIKPNLELWICRKNAFSWKSSCITPIDDWCVSVTAILITMQPEQLSNSIWNLKRPPKKRGILTLSCCINISNNLKISNPKWKRTLNVFDVVIQKYFPCEHKFTVHCSRI